VLTAVVGVLFSLGASALLGLAADQTSILRTSLLLGALLMLSAAAAVLFASRSSLGALVTGLTALTAQSMVFLAPIHAASLTEPWLQRLVSTGFMLILAGLWLIFFINGAVLSSWAPRIPLVKERLGLLDSEFGIALLGIALGAVPAMLVTARILRRVRDTALCAITTIAFPAALPAISITTGLESLTTALIILGAASGGLDVAMNALATRLQALWRIPILGRLHGAYSLGVLCGTASAVVATRLNLSVSAHFTAVSTILLIAAIAALTRPPPLTAGRRSR